MARNEALAQHIFGVELRRAERDEVFFTTRLLQGEKRLAEVQLVNLSPYGFMVRSSADVPERTLVQLALPGVGAVPARVVWALGGRLGGEFIRAIEPESYYEMLVAAQSIQSGLWTD